MRLRTLIQTLVAGSILSVANLSWAATTVQCKNNTVFNVGAGVYDITGPAAEEGMMGYAILRQRTAGIYTRLWARAFVVESPCNDKRVVFVNADLAMAFGGLRQAVLKKLKSEFGDKYNENNVLVTAIHAHSGPGGYSTYALYNLSTLGFNRNNFNVIVDGIVNAIERADANLAPATIKIASGTLKNVNHNRSPEAYLLNPPSEREQYDGDTDTTMTLLRFDRLNGKPIGLVNWFPIHGVSLNNKNHMVSSDNKGYAEYFFEKDFHSDYGSKAFVAAFAQANAGDVSSNPFGHEGDTGLAGLELVKKAGEPQYEKAKELYRNATEVVQGGIDYRHEYVDMSQLDIAPKYTDGNPQKLCTAAIGVSMLAGTQDGEGFGWQGISCDEIGNVFKYAMCEMDTTDCQGVKPIALTTGNKRPTHPWTQQVLPLQELQIGNVNVVATPFELTTMTGRRLRHLVSSLLPAGEHHHVVLSALANDYAGYTATNEEYELQDYEAASTHFGPWEAAALRQEFAKLTTALVNDLPVDHGPTPEDLAGSQTDMQTGVLYDSVPLGDNFGDVKQDVDKAYHPGDTVTAQFWGAHPKNNFRTQHSYLEVQQLAKGHWQTIRHDWDWDTEYHWERAGISESLITVVWRMPKDVAPGKYRIVQHGDWKSRWSGHITPYTGRSSVFTVA